MILEKGMMEINENNLEEIDGGSALSSGAAAASSIGTVLLTTGGMSVMKALASGSTAWGAAGGIGIALGLAGTLIGGWLTGAAQDEAQSEAIATQKTEQFVAEQRQSAALRTTVC